MAYRTSYNVICNCGHKGEINLKENDQPYSASWEEYSLTNLLGQSFSTNHATWEEVFEKTEVTCPTCKNRLSPKNLGK